MDNLDRCTWVVSKQWGTINEFCGNRLDDDPPRPWPGMACFPSGPMRYRLLLCSYHWKALAESVTAEIGGQRELEAERAVERRKSRDEETRKRAVVYFVRRADGLVKIGTSTQFERRLRTLVKEHGDLDVLGLHPGQHYELEHEYHARFARHRVEGEWFRPHPEILGVAATPPLAELDVVL